MQVRKIQATAGGTFMVTVPKEWIEQLQLKKGDLVSTELDEGSLVITPTEPKHTGHSRTIDIDQLKDQRFLDLSITASYIQGNDVTRIFSSSNKMQPHHKEMIRQTLEGIMGVEVSEDFADHVDLINLIDPAKFSLLDTVERFSATSAAVLSDAVTALDKGDSTLAKDAYSRGSESTKVYRLMMRLAFQAAKSRKLREEMNLSDISQVIVMAIATRELGRIAYYAMWVGQHVAALTQRPDRNFVSIVQRMSKTTADMQALALKALLSKDIVSANSVFQKMPQVRQLYESGYKLPTAYEEKNAYRLSLILRDIRGIAGYAVALADDAVLGIFA
ncbi:MAG TPA: phosphate uptake regulator PhoU [Nitrososphaerales archaeon]|nr:phosphate uptake regulator PhoU [Nitrososphaerales archaeon]